MKKFLKIVGIIVLFVIIIVSGLIGYVKLALPDVGKAHDMKIARTPERVARGAYLTQHVAACIGCHSIRNYSIYNAPVFDSTYAAGGERFDQSIGFPGIFYSRNITPYGIGSWTDGEVFRAITCGVSKNGTALFPVMPYLDFGTLDSEDITSIIAYIRTLPPIKNDVLPSKPDFPVNIIINTMPQKAVFTKRPDTTDHVAYGRYLVTMAGCKTCHTQDKNGELIAGKEFGGNRQFIFQKFIVTSANITPDEEAGIGSWTREAFIRRFKSYSDTTYHSKKIEDGDFNTIMPWLEYTGMKETDLGAIYDYLRTVTPIKSVVVKFKKRY